MTNIKVFASPYNQIFETCNITLWEICWQREGEQMNSKQVIIEPNGWQNPLLNEFLPEDVIQALIKKYALDGKK